MKYNNSPSYYENIGCVIKKSGEKLMELNLEPMLNKINAPKNDATTSRVI